MMNLLLVWKKYWANQKESNNTLAFRLVQSPVNYSALARGIDVNETYPAIAESQASNSSIEKEAFVYMVGTSKELAKQFKEQAQVQREQFNMIRAQQESVNTLKQILAQLLKKKKKGPKTKGKKKEGESSSSEDIESEKHSNPE